MPFNEELILKYAVVIQLFAERGSELLHLWVKVDEILANRLPEVLVAIFLLLGDQLREDTLKSVPVLDNVAMRAKNTLHGDEHLVFACYIQLELKLAHFSHYVIWATSTRISFLLSDEVLQLLARLNYIKEMAIKNKVSGTGSW